MELSILSYTKKSFSMVQVSHAGEAELIFNAGGYANTKPGALVADDTAEFGQRVELFAEVNEFISRMSKQQQDDLYECYARLESVYSTFSNADGSGLTAKYTIVDLDDSLADIIADIFKVVKLADVRDYIVGNRRIKLPAELSDEYVTNDKITPLYMERTYRKSEYIDLTAVALALRFIIPVWGNYLPISKVETNSDMKEYNGYKLLDKSELYTCAALKRLEVYIRANLVEAEYELNTVFKFLSSEEVPVYLMALALIRKLSIAPLSAENDKDHLMKIVYNYVCGNNNRMPNSFGGNIKPKTDNEGLSDDNGSVWCIYKMKEQISTGDLMIMQVYITDYLTAGKHIEPELSNTRLEQCVKMTGNLADFDPTPAQLALCIQVMSTVIAGCVVEMFDRKTLMIAMGISQAVLWEWNFPQLAILLTGKIIPMEEDEIPQVLARHKISQTNREKLEAIYPYKLPETKRSDNVMSTNPGIRGVEEIASELFISTWKPRCPKPLAHSYQRCDISGEVIVSADIRDQVAELLIKLDSYNR